MIKSFRLTRILLIVTVGCGITLFEPVQGQTDLPKIIQPSPSTAALFKYLDYPVNYSTGVPSVSIPIYEVVSGSLSVPVSISYHASGRKVTDQDGAVALGWTLNAGGMISRTMHGSADFGTNNNGLFKFPYPFKVQNIDYLNEFGYLERIIHYDKNEADAPRGLWMDSEYDIFSYSFNGNSGKFIFKDNNNVKTPALLPYKPYVIIPHFSATELYAIDITDDKGTLYKFSGGETYGLNQNSTLSGYALMQIISADKTDTIYFDYAGFAEERVSISQQVILHDLNQAYPAMPFGEVYTDVESTVRDYYQVNRLAAIRFRQGKVVFNMDAGNNKINNIQVVNLNNEVLKTIQLTRSECYGQAELSAIRHKLDAIVFKDATNNDVETYSFEYYPLVSTNGQIDVRHCDWWGYYNASGVQLMVPYYTDVPYSFSDAAAPTNNYAVGNPYYNREPNLEALKSGVLKKVIYPTGGSSEFIYENNKYFHVQPGQEKKGPGLRIAQIRTEDKSGHVKTKLYKYGLDESGYGFIDLEPSRNVMTSEVQTKLYRVTSNPDDDLRGVTYRTRTFYSGFISELGELADRPVIYPAVTEYQGTETNNTGKTIYEYDYSGWAPSGMPPPYPNMSIGKWHIYNYNYWNNPVLIKQTDFRSIPVGSNLQYQKRKEIINSYTANTSEIVYGLHIQRVYNFPGEGYVLPGAQYTPEKYAVVVDHINPYAWSDYQIPVGSKVLTQTSELLYNDDNTVIAQTSTFNYNAKELISKTTKTASDGSSLITDIKYPFDFTGNAVPDQMTALNMLNFPLEQIESKNTTPIKSVRTNYYNWGSSTPMIAPQTIDLKKGNNSYETRLRYLEYSEQGNPLSVAKEKDVPMSYVWDYNNSYPVAEVKNAAATEIAYTSFEAEGFGNWSGINGSNISTGGGSITGARYYTFNGTTLSKTGLNSSDTYVISYWSKNGAYTVSGSSVTGWPKNIRTVAINGATWTCWEHKVNGVSAINISGTGAIDELRLFPGNAQMASYCYRPLIGITTLNDANNAISYYEYDAFGRLKLIRDMDNNIIKTFEYKYKSTAP
jgi:YD repeat-containing protein